MLTHKPHTVSEADDMIDVVTDVRTDARHHHNAALVTSCDDQLLELAALRAAMSDGPPAP